VSTLKLWYNKTLKESVDKSRLYHQLVPMEIQYEYGITRVNQNYNSKCLIKNIHNQLFYFTGRSSNT